MISFNLNCIVQLKQFYNKATKVSSRKSATTFGDLPDWLTSARYIAARAKHMSVIVNDVPSITVVEGAHEYRWMWAPVYQLINGI